MSQDAEKKKAVNAVIERIRTCVGLDTAMVISAESCKHLYEYIMQLRDREQEAIFLRMEREKKVVLVLGDEDWDALYVDGRLVYENHSLDTSTVLACVGVEHELAYGIPDPDAGGYPDSIDDLKKLEV